MEEATSMRRNSRCKMRTGLNQKLDEEGEGEFGEGAHLIEGEIPPAAASSQRFARWRRTRAAAPAACRWGKERGDSRTAGARKASAVSSSCAAVPGTLWRVRGIIRAVRFVMDGALGSRQLKLNTTILKFIQSYRKLLTFVI